MRSVIYVRICVMVALIHPTEKPSALLEIPDPRSSCSRRRPGRRLVRRFRRGRVKPAGSAAVVISVCEIDTAG